MLTQIFEKDMTIKTERLILRPLKDSDAPDIFEVFSDKQVMQFYDLQAFESLERAQQQIRFFIEGFKQRKMLRWGIELKENVKLIGTCGFFGFNEDAQKAELGYELNRRYHGKGLMSEALREVLSFVFRESSINRVEAFVEPPNIASQRLLEKLGFIKEGTLRQYERCRGELIDIIIFGLLRTDGKF